MRKLQQREQRRRVEMHAILTSEQAVGLMAEMVALVKENVTDTKALQAIHNGMKHILLKRPNLNTGMTKMARAKAQEQAIATNRALAAEVAEAEGEIIDVEEVDVA